MDKVKKRKATIKADTGLSSQGEGKFTALVSAYAVEDSQGDMIMPGAFNNSINKFNSGELTVPVMYAHQWDDPSAVIGTVTAMHDTPQGLVIDAQLDLDTPNGEQAFNLLQDGRIREFSIGGEENNIVYLEQDNHLVAQVHDFDLWEVSLCLRGANPDTKLLAVKSEESPQDTTGQEEPSPSEVDGSSHIDDEEHAPFVYQLSDEQLRALIDSIRSEASTASTDSTVEAQASITVPEIEAWASQFNVRSKGQTMAVNQDMIKDKLAKVKAISDKAVAEHREFTEDEAQEIMTLKSEVDQLNKDIERGNEIRATVKAMLGDTTEIAEKAKENMPNHQPVAKTIGEAFTKSDAYKQFQGSTIPDGSPVRIAKSRVSTKDGAPQVNTGNGFGVFPTVEPGYTDLTYRRPLSILNYIARGVTASSFVQYRQLVNVDSNASVVEEGGLKPLSAIGTQVAEAKTWTCADGVKVTNQELADDGIIATVINETLTKNLNLLLEDLVLNGDGKTDGQPLGILHTQGVQQVAFDKDIVTTTSHARTALSKIGTNIGCVVLNPEDAETVLLMQDKNGAYYGNGPFSAGPNTLWGIPIVESQAIPVGTGIMGDFSTVQLLNREPLTIEAFNQNEDDARHNLTYVRAEERNLLFIREPRRLAVMSFAASTPASK